MIRVFGVVMISSYSQTLNMYKDFTYVIKVLSKNKLFDQVGPFW